MREKKREKDLKECAEGQDRTLGNSLTKERQRIILEVRSLQGHGDFLLPVHMSSLTVHFSNKFPSPVGTVTYSPCSSAYVRG